MVQRILMSRELLELDDLVKSIEERLMEGLSLLLREQILHLNKVFMNSKRR